MRRIYNIKLNYNPSARKHPMYATIPSLATYVSYKGTPFVIGGWSMTREHHEDYINYWEIHLDKDVEILEIKGKQ